MIFLDIFLHTAASKPAPDSLDDESKSASYSDNHLDDGAEFEWQTNLVKFLMFRSEHGDSATPDTKSKEKMNVC